MDKACQYLLGDINTTHVSTGTSTDDNMNSNLIENEKPPHSSSFNVINETIRKNLPKSSTKLLDLKRSGIIFDGESCVREFIVRIEDYFLGRNFDEALLIGAFSDLLSGTASKWFRHVRINICSWYQLKVELLKRFDKPNYDYLLEESMRTRKQETSETLPDFITNIRDMSSRLFNPPSDVTLFTIIKHNMLSVYKPHFVDKDINTWERFETLAKLYEPMVDKSNLVNEKISKNHSVALDTKNLVCRKCEGTGHNYKSCTKITGLVCFNCKTPGKTTRNCDICTAKNTAPSKNL